MKDYASMSDQQINREVQKLTGMGCMSGNGVLIIADGRWRTFDPCNNPADAWPILLENHIAVAPYKYATPCAWPSSEGLISKHVTEDGNPLRAGMIVYLKMKESKND